MADRTCTVDGCDSLLIAKGLCRRHYDAARSDKRRRNPKAPELAPQCDIDGCRRPRFCRGWCSAHYGRWLKHGDPLAGRAYSHRGPRLTEPAERIWMKIRRVGSCWEWTGYVCPISGYGRASNGPAHRHVYEIIVGPIPDDLHLDHLCRNRRCVNPAHLEPVTPAENTRRGEGNGHETHCPQGHAYDEANTYRWTNPDGYTRRYCRACARERREAKAASTAAA